MTLEKIIVVSQRQLHDEILTSSEGWVAIGLSRWAFTFIELLGCSTAARIKYLT